MRIHVGTSVWVKGRLNVYRGSLSPKLSRKVVTSKFGHSPDCPESAVSAIKVPTQVARCIWCKCRLYNYASLL